MIPSKTVFVIPQRGVAMTREGKLCENLTRQYVQAHNPSVGLQAIEVCASVVFTDIGLSYQGIRERAAKNLSEVRGGMLSRCQCSTLALPPGSLGRHDPIDPVVSACLGARDQARISRRLPDLLSAVTVCGMAQNLLAADDQRKAASRAGGDARRLFQEACVCAQPAKPGGVPAGERYVGPIVRKPQMELPLTWRVSMPGGYMR